MCIYIYSSRLRTARVCACVFFFVIMYMYIYIQLVIIIQEYSSKSLGFQGVALLLQLLLL